MNLVNILTVATLVCGVLALIGGAVFICTVVKFERELAKNPLNYVKPDSMWLVKYNNIPTVIRVATDREGFFMPGKQEKIDFKNITEWVSEIIY